MLTSQNTPTTTVGQTIREIFVAFMMALWPIFPSNAILCLWTRQGKTTYPFDFPADLNAAAAQVEHLAKHAFDVYFAIGLQAERPAPGKRGDEAGVIAVPGPWMDIDILGPGHKQAALPQNEEEALEFVAAFPLKPSIITNTGGGLQAFWLLKQPLVISEDTERTEVKKVSTRFQQYLIARGRERGWQFDSTPNLDRLLRVPGTFNYKDPTNPRQVRILHLDPSCRYTVEEIEAVLPAEPVKGKGKPNLPAKRGAKAIVPAGSKFPQSDANKIVGACAWVTDCIANAITLPEPLWYAFLSIIARCENGRDLCHEYSQPYPNYNFDETERKIDQALNNAGPRTCENIRANCGGEEFCAVCPHWGKIKSPILLGYDQAERARILLPAVVDVLPGAPASPNLIVPFGYRISYAGGVEQLRFDKDGNEIGSVQCCRVPVLLTKRLKRRDDGYERLVIAYFRYGRWHELCVNRGDLADLSKIVPYANIGLPVIKEPKSQFTHSCLDFELANDDNIPIVELTQKLGWHRDGTAFVLGHQVFKANENDPDLEFDAGDDKGAAQTAEAYHAKGSAEAWFAMANRLYEFPLVLGNVFIGFVPVLLDIFGIDNFTYDLSGVTTKGKSIAQKVSASAQGDPGELIQTFNTTNVYLEFAASALNGLALYFDETKLAGEGKQKAQADAKISHALYEIASGKGKSRGSKTGTRRTSRSRTVLNLTGEIAAVEHSTQDGGSHARALSFTGLPFNCEDDLELVNYFENTAKENYGHAMPLFIRWVLDHSVDCPQWREAYRELALYYANRSTGGSVGGRIAKHFAALAMIAVLAHAALPQLKPDRPVTGVLDALWRMLEGNAERADLPIEALKDLYSWCTANASRFYGRHEHDQDGNDKVPYAGWAGVWHLNKPMLYVSKLTVEAVLGDKYPLPTVGKEWKRRDLIATGQKGLTQWIHVRSGTKMGCFCFKLGKLLEVGIDTTSEDSGNF
jgi:hypothetical protein